MAEVVMKDKKLAVLDFQLEQRPKSSLARLTYTRARIFYLSKIIEGSEKVSLEVSLSLNLKARAKF